MIEADLAAIESTVGNDKDGGGVGVSGDLELGEGRSVAVQRLGLLLVHRVELHLSDNPAVNSRNANEGRPLEVGINTVADDLRTSQVGVAVKELDGVLATYMP
jgi:hypothetical protein